MVLPEVVVEPTVVIAIAHLVADLIATILAIVLTFVAIWNSIGAIIRQRTVADRSIRDARSITRSRTFDAAGSFGNAGAICDARSITRSWAFDAAGSIGNARALAGAGPLDTTRAGAWSRQGAGSIL
jgi:hypothetical protein